MNVDGFNVSDRDLTKGLILCEQSEQIVASSISPSIVRDNEKWAIHAVSALQAHVLKEDGGVLIVAALRCFEYVGHPPKC